MSRQITMNNSRKMPETKTKYKELKFRSVPNYSLYYCIICSCSEWEFQKILETHKFNYSSQDAKTFKSFSEI